VVVPAVERLTDAELYALMAPALHTTAAELVALSNEAFAAMVRDLCQQVSEPVGER
jgi:hypothetical protein